MKKQILILIIVSLLGLENKLLSLTKVKVRTKTGSSTVHTHAEGMTPLMKAARLGQNAKVKTLLKKDPSSVNKKDKEGMTPFMIASQRGYLNVVETLIRAGADINLQNKKGMTALMLATNWGYRYTVETLIRAGADINLKNKKGKTALMLALDNGFIDMALAINPNGNYADQIKKITVNANNQKGALLDAVSSGDETLVKALLDNGAKVNQQALNWSAADGFYYMTLHLLSKVDPQDNINKQTALLFAAENGCYYLIKALLRNITLTDALLQKASKAAQKGGYPDVVELLNSSRARLNNNKTSGDQSQTSTLNKQKRKY